MTCDLGELLIQTADCQIHSVIKVTQILWSSVAHKGTSCWAITGASQQNGEMLDE